MNQPNAEVNIHLRARAADRDLITQAAELVGSNRSQFMLASALKEAKAVLLDQTHLRVNAATFAKVLDMLDREATEEQEAGLKRLARREMRWARD